MHSKHCSFEAVWDAPADQCLLWQVSLVQQPALFDRAFQRLFSKELARVAAETSAGGPGGASSVGRDPAASWALDRFWQRPSTKAPLPRRPAVPRAGEEMSRYLSDFQVDPYRVPAMSLSR